MEHSEIRNTLVSGGYPNLAELFVYAEALDVEHFDMFVSINGVATNKIMVVPDSFEEFATFIKNDELDDTSIEFLRDLNEVCTVWLDELIPMYNEQNNASQGQGETGYEQ